MTDARMSPKASWIIPGDWGMAESGWLTQPLLKSDRKVETAEALFTSSSGGVRASSVTRSRDCRGEE